MWMTKGTVSEWEYEDEANDRCLYFDIDFILDPPDGDCGYSGSVEIDKVCCVKVIEWEGNAEKKWHPGPIIGKELSDWFDEILQKEDKEYECLMDHIWAIDPSENPH